LARYSRDLNPIEKFWANMKRWIKNKIHLFDNLYAAIQAFFTLPNSS
jgi:transposase